MLTSDSVPTYTVVGHPNEGKSSVVATLTEDDTVRISPIPGETTLSRAYPVQIDGRTVIQFVDTPGFQYPRRILEWFRQEGSQSQDLAQGFIDSQGADPNLSHDIELLTPLSKGCGVIYVIDGSRPISSTDRIEMEILRLTGNPRMAIINPKEYHENYIAQWKSACAKAFNSIRLFDAHQATYSERISLLESLKGINQDWEAALAKAIDAFEDDWANRIHQVAGLLCELVRDSTTLSKSKSIFQPSEEEPAKKRLQEDYQKAIHQTEKANHQCIRKLFKHNIFNIDIPPQSVLNDDLFTERTWQVLGLSKKQIISTGAFIGGGLGVNLDLALAGLSFGIFTLSGAVAGAATAWLKGEDLARAKIKKQKLGGIKITVGPNTNPQFPFILLDRAMLYFKHISNWAHARSKPPEGQDQAIEISLAEKGFTSHWSKQQRQVCAQFIKAVSTDASYEKQAEAERECRKMLEEALLAISKNTVSARPSDEGVDEPSIDE
jgi:hypothetical protein